MKNIFDWSKLKILYIVKKTLMGIMFLFTKNSLLGLRVINFLEKIFSNKDGSLIGKVFIHFSYIYFKKGDWNSAEKILLNRLEKNVNNQKLLSTFAELAMRRGDWAKAIRRWSVVRDKFPNVLDGYTKGSKALRENNDHFHAEKLLTQAVKRFPNEPQALFDAIDLQITFRCNMKCANCIEFCNMQNITGLDLHHTDKDMTLGQIKYFINDVKSLQVRKLQVSKSINITGGEPLLHPNICEITQAVEKELVMPGLIGELFINSNLTIKPLPELKNYIVNFTRVKDKKIKHSAVLLHPLDFNKISPTFKDCLHHRKWIVVCNYFGYSLCCAGDAYIRLFNLEELIHDHLPNGYGSFLLEKMDTVCRHCPFGNCNPPLEKDIGRPISKYYLVESLKNKSGRKIKKVLPEF